VLDYSVEEDFYVFAFLRGTIETAGVESLVRTVKV